MCYCELHPSKQSDCASLGGQRRPIALLDCLRKRPLGVSARGWPPQRCFGARPPMVYFSEIDVIISELIIHGFSLLLVGFHFYSIVSH
jgi:hypothetical protein